MQNSEHTIEPVYELVEQHKGDSFLVLTANGGGCVCPFQPIMPIQTAKGMEAGRSLCNTSCPLAEVEEIKANLTDDKPKYLFTIFCGKKEIGRQVTVKRHSDILILKPKFQA